MKRHSLLSALLLALVAAWAALVGHAEQAAPLRLTSPKGGETWSVDSKHTITWEATTPAAGGTVKVEFTTDRGQTWHEVAAAAPNTGRFLWKVPDRVSAGCRVRVSQLPTGKNSESPASFAIVPSQEVHDYEWVSVTKRAAFAPRDGAGAVVFRGRMWLLGGWNPGDRKHFPRVCNNEVWSSADGAAWTLERPNTFLDRTFDAARDWEGRHTAGYVVYKGRMWIVGGDVNQGHYHFDVWNSADGKQWTYVNKGRPVPWGPRALHHTLVFDDKIWVLGGQTMPSFARAREVFYRDAWHTSDGVNWRRVLPREPYWSARGMIGGSAVFKGRMWILGGGTYDTPTTPARKYYHDVWSSANGVDWQRHVEFAPWEPRQYHEVAVFDDRLWVLEGYARGNRNDVWYSADGVNWYEVSKTPWRPRHAASAYVHDGALWMVAGNNMESDVWKLRRKPPAGAGG
jgi:hypothetical protein